MQAEIPFALLQLNYDRSSRSPGEECATILLDAGLLIATNLVAAKKTLFLATDPSFFLSHHFSSCKHQEKKNLMSALILGMDCSLQE
jgi:hypothetical protein